MPRSSAQSVERDVNSSLQAAQKSWGDFGLVMQVLQSKVQLRRFDEAEAERGNLHALLDLYLDNYAAAHRRLAVG